MLAVGIDLLFALAVAVLGSAGGWWLRGSGVRRQLRQNGMEGQRNREVMARLHDLAARVAADVGEHKSRVEEINEELAAAKTPESETVVSAVARLIQTNQQMQQQLVTAREKLREQAKQMESSAAEARTDALTGLANRRAFDQEIGRSFDAFLHENTDVAMLFIDVDHFKRFNDTYGHQVGDVVLSGLAGVLTRHAGANNLVCRYGGEEFAIVLPKTSLEAARDLAEEIRKAVQVKRFHANGQELTVTISTGVAGAVAGEPMATFIRRADAAVYASKDAGRNCVSWHDGKEIRTLRPSEAVEEPAEMPAAPAVKAPEATAAPVVAAPLAQAPTAAPAAADPHNRAAFESVLTRRLAERRRSGQPVSMILLHVDKHAEILARHGSPAGDLAMRITMQFLNASFRDMDLVVPYQESTFAALLPETRLPQTLGIAERLRQAIARCKFPVGSDRFNFTVSVAGAESLPGDDTNRLLQRTEEALAAAIRAGGDCTWLHNGRAAEPADVAATAEPAANAYGTIA